MRLLSTKIPSNHHYDVPPQWWREVNALRAVAINPETHPILATHWDGPLLLNGVLYCRDESPLTKRFKTAPIPEIKRGAA